MNSLSGSLATKVLLSFNDSIFSLLWGKMLLFVTSIRIFGECAFRRALQKMNSWADLKSLHHNALVCYLACHTQNKVQ